MNCAAPVPVMERHRFGIFDFDPQTGELRREGRVVRLQAQPAQVLGVLLSHAGSLVTRDTLREVVWGSGTFVDFDRGAELLCRADPVRIGGFGGIAALH